MRAMILAAGRGERMRELTQKTPKPLLKVAGKYLIEYAILNLKAAGIFEIVINVSYHARKIQAVLGDGARYGVHICYSEEPERLEVGGGLVKALPLLGDDPFIVVSADVITDYPLSKLKELSPKISSLAHLVMVENPTFHPEGDFGLVDGFANLKASPKFTFANIGIYRKELFAEFKPQFFPWKTLLFPAIEKNQVTAECYQGVWYNIGTPQDFSQVNSLLVSS
jgi:N-acetyl-alpha-D-muramate 1-phosphate uridylyltransferase